MRTALEVCASNAVLATVLAVLAAGLGRLHPRPAFRHTLWLLVLLKLITPPLVLIPASWLGLSETRALPVIQAPRLLAAESDGSTWFVRAQEREPSTRLSLATVHASREWAKMLLTVWVVGSGAWFALAFVQVYRSLRFWRRAYRASAGLHQQVRNLAKSLNLKHCPEVWVVASRVSPMMWWLGGRPRILIPDALLEDLSEEQRATLLVHELAHVRRRDHWTRLLELLVTGLYWWHPVLWWARHELRLAEEECCDAWVLWTLPQAGYTYATTLLQTLDFLAHARPALPLGASGIGYASHVQRRLTKIMTGATVPGLTGAGRWGLLAVGLVLMLSFESQADPQDASKSGPPALTKAKGPEPSQELKAVQGTLQRFTTAPKGEVHGFVLSDGSEVHYPPHLEKRVLALVAQGDRVRVTGRIHTGPKGDTRLEAESITNLGSQTTIQIAPPPPREDEKAKE